MTTELIAAPPACGKTTECIRRIQVLRARQPLAAIRVIVPDRLQASAFRQRLAASGGAIGTAVGTFGDLYCDILQRAGRVYPQTSSILAHRLVQATVSSAMARGDLQYYGTIHALPGFHLVLGVAFAELKRAMVHPDQLADYVAGKQIAQQELALLYAQYQQRLLELGWADQEGTSWLAVAALQAHPRLVGSTQLLIFDGFDTFSGAQRQALSELANHVEALVITLPLTPGSDRAAEKRFSGIYVKLISDLHPQVTSLPADPHLPADLRHITQNLFVNNAPPIAMVEHCVLLQARSPADEAREALRWVKAHVVRDKTPLSSCAIFTPDLPFYRPFLSAAASEFGIPLAFTEHESLDRSPALAALVNLVGLPGNNFKTRYLFNALRSPYFALGITSLQIDKLELISRVATVVEGRDQWQDTWARLVQISPSEQEPLGEEYDLPNLPHGIAASELEDALASVFSLLEPPEGECSYRGWVDWFEDLLEKVNFYKKADSDQDKVVCETIREVLRTLVSSEMVAGERQADYSDFIADLSSMLAGSPLPEVHHWNSDCLLVGRLLEARGLRFRAVAILGLSEGVFPVVERPDPLLDEHLREKFDMEPRLQRDQAGLFYQAVTRADQSLLLTRPYLAEGGEAWEESPYWLEVKRLLPPTAIRTIRPDDARPLVEAASAQELLFTGVRRGAITQEYNGLLERFARLRFSREVLRARRAKLASGPFEGEANELSTVMRQRYPQSVPWSASRLEQYGTCPFYFYINTALALEPCEPPEFGLDAAQLGSILHKILEETYRLTPDPTDTASLLDTLVPTANRVFASAPQLYGFRPSALWQSEQDQLLEALVTTITELTAHSDGWTPVAFECQFGRAGKPPLRLELENGHLLLRGVIDRVDRRSDGAIRVIDYKSGSSHLATADLLNGRRLQLPLYALAARDALGYGEPVEGWYWKILAADASSLKLGSFESQEGHGIEGAYRVLYAHLARILTGIRDAAFPPAPPAGGCPAYCPAAGWCWRYETSGW